MDTQQKISKIAYDGMRLQTKLYEVAKYLGLTPIATDLNNAASAMSTVLSHINDAKSKCI